MQTKGIGTRSPLFVYFFFVAFSSSPALAESEFEAWKRQQLQEYSDYKSKLDKEFSAFLKAHWVEIEGKKEEPLFKKKKFVEPPKAPKPVKKTPSKTQPIVKLPEKKKAPVIPPKPALPPPPPVRGPFITITYFGNRLEVPYERKIQERLHQRLNKESIAKRWELLATSDYEAMLKQLDTHKTNLHLNDWAYAILVNRVAEAIYPRQNNEQALFSWFVLLKTGYRARLAYEDNRAYLLLPVQQQIYSAQSLSYKGQKYYILDFDGGKQPRVSSVFTYDNEYGADNRLFDLQLKQLLATGNKTNKRTLRFNYERKEYKFESANNQYVVDFMRTYPQVHWDVYFNATPDNPVRQQLAEQLRPHLKNMTEVEAVNFLLRFVQTSFKYDTDDGQFGYENPLFPEETLFYPASDCEDRSFLFSWLVRELLGLEVIGLLYKGHMATAVRLNTPLEGDSVRYQGKQFLVADPTYTNADIGMAMPKFRNAKAEFLKIDKI